MARPRPKRKPTSRPRRESHGFISSWVRRAWWDPESKVVEVEFNDGVHWTYSEVPRSMWESFKGSSSAGAFIRQNLERHPNQRR